MHKYKKEELVRYLASLHLFPQNSSNILRLSMLLYEALSMKGGEEHLVIPKFQKEIEKNYPYDINEDPQEYLLVDTVHTPRGTYRVFPGLFSYLQYNLTRLFELLEMEKLDEKLFLPVYAVLEISDELARRCCYGRYEKGEPEYDGLYCSDYKESHEYQEKTSFKFSDIKNLLTKLGTDKSLIQTLTCHPKRKEFEDFILGQEGYSPIETAPFYTLNDGRVIVLQPSALLSAAYFLCMGIIKQQIEEEKLNRSYLDILMSETARIMTQSGADNCGGAIVDDRIGYLLYRYDVDGLACVIVSHRDIEDEGFMAVRAAIKEQYPDAKVFYVETVNSLGMEMPSVSTRITHIIIPIDEFKIMIGQKGMNLTDLYYYYEERKGQKNLIGQEIDIFAAYWESKHTFYLEETPFFNNFVTGTAYDMRWRYLSKRDEHLVEGPGHLMMVSHFDEYPDDLPIYVPFGSKDHTVFVGEYGQTSLTVIVGAQDEGERLLLREIAKCLVVWTYGFGYKYGENLLNGDIKVVVSFYDGVNPRMRQLDKDCLEYSIPRRFYNMTPRDKTHDQLIVGFWVEALIKFGLTNIEDAYMKVNTLFQECNGHLLLIEPQGVEYWMVNDGHQATYYLNENACDRVLDDIAKSLNMAGEFRSLNLEESKVVTLKVIEFLGNSLNGMLTKFASDKFVDSLLEIHHGSLFWIVTTSRRFENVNGVMNYFGADWREQKELLQKYSETNNLTQCLLERIVSNGCHSTCNPKLVEIDTIYAYMHELYIYGTYLDILTFKIPGTEMAILANGRVGLPHEKMNEQMAYFADIRENELYRPDDYRKLHGLQPNLNIDVNESVFQDAFKDEFKIDYEKWRSVIELSLKYAFDLGKPIVKMAWDEFENQILLKVLSSEGTIFFKSVFCLHKDMASGSKASESFAQRFNRKFQISTRPWICHQGFVFFTTKSLHQHEHVMLDRLNEGKIHAESPKMKVYMGVVNSQKGVAFERNLKSFYESLGHDGLKVFRGIKIGPGERLDNNEPLGDIDVLLINTTLKKIVCVETKDYSESRTIYDMLLQNRKTGYDLEMPLKRDAWSKNHISTFSNLCDKVDATYTCESVFVTVNMPAYQYSPNEKESSIKIIPALDIMDDPMIVFNV